MENIPSPPPKLSAYELLGSEPRPYPFLSQHFNPLFFTVMGVGMAATYTYVTKRPIFSGIQNHIGLGAAGFVLGKYWDDRRNQRLARKDAVLRHYIELHPEDFPEPERKMFKDILIPWTPIR
ncbi:NADH dehydrogenase [ubiquinone] 1 subunit C2 [Ischnura elegans]|uniref:NADH dehydrogenase [ubiquinone] 1 subunit C2 n=1 Tax=Ischnura elegans TaxID=197161 RepID=UPI001ED8A82E|nr:NADH dehydrogenase [ubiquinone] 1 subunit C2 [Ischnura elegans]